jgi:hypothetical protein
VREKFPAAVNECSRLLIDGSDSEAALALTILNLILVGESPPARPKPAAKPKRPNT